MKPKLHKVTIEEFVGPLITISQSGIVLTWNRPAEILFGYTAEEAAGKPYADLIIPADRIDESQRWLKVALRKGTATYDSVIRTKDGSLINVEIAQRIVQQDATATIIGMNIRDITELKCLRDAKFLESRFGRGFEVSPDAMIIINSQGRIVLTNAEAARLFGYTREELLEDRKRYLSNPLLRPMGADLELFGRRRDGNEFPIEISLSPITTDDGILTFSAIRDITERKRSERLAQRAHELAWSNEELQQFAYAASHDLQEPLRMIMSYGQLLERRYKGKVDNDADEFIDFMVGGARRMQALIEGLSAYARVGSQGRPLQHVDSNVALHEALQNLAHAIKTTNATVVFNELPAVWADHVQLVKLFQNLIANAIKFRRDEDPVIRIHAELKPDEWLFSVQDNGIGLEPQHKERIFVIFQRLHPASEYPGTGVGLAVCKRIIERHGGRIGVDSKPGEGSTFWFTLSHVHRLPLEMESGND